MNILNNEQKQILDFLYEEPYKIGHFVGFKDLTELHNEWLRSFLYSKQDETLLAHRGSYKTTDLSLFLALHTIVEPNKNIMFFRKTDTDVNEVIEQTAKILQAGCVRRIVKILFNRELLFDKCTSSEINTNLKTSISGSSQILGLGIGTSITGKHADVVVTDDIVNLKDRISRAERERTKIQYMELQNIKNRGGRFINTGTPWHKDDAISLMPNIKKFDCYSTGLMSAKQIKDVRASMTDSLFAANYELKHIADTDAVFKNPQFTNETKLIYDGLAHIDASYGGADRTALTIFRKTEAGYIGFGKCWKKHVDECINEICELMELYRAGSVRCEDNADKGYLRKELNASGLIATGYHESMNKFVKISTYLKRAWASIKWLDDTDPEYLAEILDYTETAAHDDCPDSAASLIREMDKQITYHTVTGGL